MRISATSTRPQDARFRHEALFYSGPSGFVERTSTFLADAIAADEPVLVVVNRAKIEMLRSRLDGGADLVRFADMAEVGKNPARIIPAWREFVAEHAGAGRFRGVGEPIWASRTPDELAECERHESLLNLAFAEGPPWWLVCPYDMTSLDPSVLEEAERNHPFVLDGAGARESETYRDLDAIARPFDRPLPKPPASPHTLTFGRDDLHDIRMFVSGFAAAHLSGERIEDLVLAVSEVATNSVRHGGGGGELRIWHQDDVVVCEVRDAGHIDDPLVGRQHPRPSQSSGFGMWLANQLCDLVQVRSLRTGSVVRLHVSQGRAETGDAPAD